MNQLHITSSPEFLQKIDSYPEQVREQMKGLRKLVHEVANEAPEVIKIEETLKWGEPSFVTKHGSTLRMDWKKKTPDQYAMYFKCTSRLVETFKIVYKDTFQFEGTRAIVFGLKDPVPKEALKACIKATLSYHKVKKLPTLGI